MDIYIYILYGRHIESWIYFMQCPHLATGQPRTSLIPFEESGGDDTHSRWNLYRLNIGLSHYMWPS